MIQEFHTVQDPIPGQDRQDRARNGAETSVAPGLWGLGAMTLMALLLSGCGQKGPLTLPSATPPAMGAATPTLTTSPAPAPARAASTPTR